MAHNPFRTDGNHFRSLSGAGSMVELLSNMSVLAPIQLEKHYAQIRAGELPPEIASEVMHEFTHHWCFHSEVGSALTGLYFRILRRAAGGGRRAAGGGRRAAGATTIEPVFADIFRFETARSVLQPISEGLALFAEFDVKPGKHNTRSPIFVGWLSLFRATALEDGIVWAFDTPFERIFSRMRDNDRPALLKESLLCKPLGTHQGGYLAGYLAIKALWHEIRHEVLDAELFWCFLRSFFFHDYAFLDAILEPKKIEHIHSAILDYFEERLALLRTMDLPAALLKFDTDANQFRSPVPIPAPDTLRLLDLSRMPTAINVDEARAEKGINFANALLSEVLDFEAEADLISRLTFHTFSRRHLLCFGAVAGRVTIQDGIAEFVSESGFSHRAEAVPEAEEKKDSGSFEVYYDTKRDFLVEIITINTQVVSIHLETTQPESDLYKPSLTTTFFDRKSILEINKDVDSQLETFIRQQPVIEALDAVRNHTKEVVDWIYAGHYLTSSNCHDSDKRDQLWDMMAEDGFWSILDQDLDLVRGVSILGVGQAAGWSDADIDYRLREEELERGEVIRRVKEVEAKLGLQLLDNNGVTLRV